MLSVAIGATPVIGAIATAQEGPPILAQAEIGAQERALFEQAAQSGNAGRINAFLRTYPDSPLVRALLVNLPPETLQLVEPSSLALVNPATLRTLPITVRLSLGLGAPSNLNDQPGTGGTIDGYAG